MHQNGYFSPLFPSFLRFSKLNISIRSFTWCWQQVQKRRRERRRTDGNVEQTNEDDKLLRCRENDLLNHSSSIWKDEHNFGVNSTKLSDLKYAQRCLRLRMQTRWHDTKKKVQQNVRLGKWIATKTWFAYDNRKRKTPNVKKRTERMQTKSRTWKNEANGEWRPHTTDKLPYMNGSSVLVF